MKMNLIKHILRHYQSEESLNKDFLNNYLTSTEIKTDELKSILTMPGSKFSPLFTDNPELLINECNALIKEMLNNNMGDGKELEIVIKRENGESLVIGCTNYTWNEGKEITYNLTINCSLNENINYNWYKNGIGYSSLVDNTHPDWNNRKKTIRSGYPVNTLEGAMASCYQFFIPFTLLPDKTISIKTICPGVWAPKFPNQIDPAEKEKIKFSEEFWENHALIIQSMQ
jgi:hypothetical protein